MSFETSNQQQSLWSQPVDHKDLSPSMRIWGQPNLRAMNGFLPLIKPYALEGQFQSLNRLLKQMPVGLANGEAGLLGQNRFRKTLNTFENFSSVIVKMIESYKSDISEVAKNKVTADLAMLFRDFQYLTMGYLFEGVHHGQAQAESILPAAIANPLVLLAGFFQQKPWLEYASGYVLLNSVFGEAIEADKVHLIRMWHGGPDEFFFQTVHSVIEWQTPALFQAIADVFEGIELSNDEQVERGLDLGIEKTQCMLDHLKTMTRLSRPAYYSSHVRPQIQGLVGNCGEGKLFSEQGVFFESGHINALDSDLAPQQTALEGGFINSIRGQTGAQSSIIPLLDNFLGVNLFYAQGDNPLTQMLREFRSYRPKPHTQLLEAVETEAARMGLYNKLKARWPLKHAQWVSIIAQFRAFHYYLAMAYIIKPGLKAPAHQSRAVGTGGSPTPNYLPQHLRESLEALQDILASVDLSKCSKKELSMVNALKAYSEKTSLANEDRARMVGDYLDGKASETELDKALDKALQTTEAEVLVG